MEEKPDGRYSQVAIVSQERYRNLHKAIIGLVGVDVILMPEATPQPPEGMLRVRINSATPEARNLLWSRTIDLDRESPQLH